MPLLGHIDLNTGLTGSKLKPVPLVNLLRSQNVVVRKGALTEEQVEQLRRAYEAATTIAALETQTGIPHGTIQRALNAAGAPMRPRGSQVN